MVRIPKLMKDFLKNYKFPLIFGGAALIVMIVTLIIVTGGGSSYGLYISSASGSVSVTRSDSITNSTGGDELENGDILTVGKDSTCTLAYKGRKNSENNYLVVGEDSQLVVSSDFNGKEDGELFLRSGSVIGNFIGDDRSSINIRTADSMITTSKSVSKIFYSTNEFMSYTDLYTFMGNSTIQLYSEAGTPVNNAELQIEKKWGRIVSEDGPYFDSLNLDFNLEELTSFDLKTLISIAAIVGDDFPYSAEELKEAYDIKAENEPDSQPGNENADSSATDTSGTIQTAEPIVTEPAPTETTLPGQTAYVPPATAAPQPTTTAAPVTLPPATETEASQSPSSNNGKTHTVTIVIDGEETIQEVAHGEDAVKPDDPVVDGLTFIGWDGSFENVTEDRIINAIFSELIDNNTSTEQMHTVTVVIGNRSSTIQVEHGKSANLPNTLNVDGYIFKGWDKDFSYITEDVTITAILEPVGVHTVTFVVDGQTYTVQVEHGGFAMPTYIPQTDSNGNRFTGWDKSLDNIIADTTITAIFESENYHTVTFIIDGEFFNVRVSNGETAEPPFYPVTDRDGNRFVGWDKSRENITSDTVITAYFE